MLKAALPKCMIITAALVVYVLTQVNLSDSPVTALFCR